MALYLVRPAKAGDRARWDGDDEHRPLSKNGTAQTAAITKWFKDVPVSRILSSPYVRCTQTVAPLGKKQQLPVEATPALAEEQPFEPVLDLLATLPEESVLCSHGDVILDTINALVRRGMTVENEPDWRKGTIWVLERDGEKVLRGRVVPPPPPRKRKGQTGASRRGSR
jgi:phosphohistidine phosphatase SixA